jgi:hypothetical protein
MGQKMSQLAKPEMPHLPWFTVDDRIGKPREVEKQECICDVNPG